MQALSDTYDFKVYAYVALDGQGEPKAGLPFTHIKDPLGERLVSLPFSDYCDPLVHPRTWDSLSNRLLADQSPVMVRCLTNTLPLSDKRFVLVKRSKWHAMDLRPDSATLWQRIHGSARRAIRKAERNRVSISIAQTREELRTFFELHLQVRKHKYQLLAQPYAFFEALYFHFLERQQGALMLATYEKEVIGGVMFLGWEDKLYYKFNASAATNLGHRPNDLLVWSGVQYGKANGYTQLDFGLSDWDQIGLINYKRKFASEEKTLSFLHYKPDKYLVHGDEQFPKLLSQLTKLFTDPAIPDRITESAGDALYKFFA
jgi:CelD/BcsL family acetyltransferase involved in cellulose biosynthesis